MARTARPKPPVTRPLIWWNPWRIVIGALLWLFALPVVAQTPARPAPGALEEALHLRPDTVAGRKAPALEVGALIVDQTLSKIGHDFYDLFYSQWETPPGTDDFLIEIREKPSRGLGTLITLVVNDAEVLEMPVQPKLDQIEASAAMALQATHEYVQANLRMNTRLNEDADQLGNGIF